MPVPFRDWLCNLVAPLSERQFQTRRRHVRKNVYSGQRTGLPDSGFLDSHLLYTFLVGKYKYIWGGGLAIPKAVFEKANLMSHINGKGGCSITTDDMNIYVALRDQGYDTLFMPHCILFRTPPEKTERLLHVVRFTNRQRLQTWWTNKVIFTFLVHYWNKVAAHYIRSGHFMVVSALPAGLIFLIHSHRHGYDGAQNGN